MITAAQQQQPSNSNLEMSSKSSSSTPTIFSLHVRFVWTASSEDVALVEHELDTTSTSTGTGTSSEDNDGDSFLTLKYQILSIIPEDCNSDGSFSDAEDLILLDHMGCEVQSNLDLFDLTSSSNNNNNTISVWCFSSRIASAYTTLCTQNLTSRDAALVQPCHRIADTQFKLCGRCSSGLFDPSLLVRGDASAAVFVAGLYWLVMSEFF